MEGKRSHKSRVKTLSFLYTHHVCGCPNYGLMRWLALLKLAIFDKRRDTEQDAVFAQVTV